jgi:hypothetical protein
MRKGYKTIYRVEEPDIEIGDEVIPGRNALHFDLIKKTGELHIVHFDMQEKHDLEGYMLAPGDAVAAAIQILRHYAPERLK